VKTIILLLSLWQAEKAPPSEVAGIPVNYDEAKVGTYTLPDLHAVNKEDWVEKRRPELIRLFEENQFGKRPANVPMSVDVFDKGTPVFDGKAIRRQVTIHLAERKITFLMYLPKASKPAPFLLHISFAANSNTVDDPGLPPVEGRNFGKINVPRLIDAGLGVGTFYYQELEPDTNRHLDRAPDEAGTIAWWAWGLSRVMDYLETDKGIDAKNVTIMGVSRLGKTVMWAGAQDTRFAGVIASCSGEGGAALSRRNYGETVAHLTAPSRYPYQFTPNYAKYANDVNAMPVDAHMLVALIAPRRLLLQTGDKDFWSDPKGEELAAEAAAPAYKLFGASKPEYFMHQGGHGTIPSDWDVYLKFLTHPR
jgi:hypothetical protein